MGCGALLQGIFPTQGSNPRPLCLLHCRQILNPLSHQGSPNDSTQTRLDREKPSLYLRRRPAHGAASVSYKTGDVPVAHPLLSELPRHVESANKCLSTIGSMVAERGAKKEGAKRDLDKFILHR